MPKTEGTQDHVIVKKELPKTYEKQQKMIHADTVLYLENIEHIGGCKILPGPDYTKQHSFAEKIMSSNNLQSLPPRKTTQHIITTHQKTF